MKCLDDCHQYVIETVMGATEYLPFYKMSEDGKKIDGVTNEEVISVLIHRLEKLNEKFFCPENSFAIDNLRGALMWLARRTEDRTTRGVEGTHQK